MKLIDRLVDEALNRASVLVELATSISRLATATQNIAEALAQVALQVEVHQQALEDLYLRTGVVKQAIKTGSLNTDMPAFGGREKPVKPS